MNVFDIIMIYKIINFNANKMNGLDIIMGL